MKPGRHLFEKDFYSLSAKFPKLLYQRSNKLNSWIIHGDIDIHDTNGDYWNTFKIRIIIPYNYPNCIPIVQELSDIIPREEDWHIDEKGICCIDMPHKLQIRAKRGIRIIDFIEEMVYPYLANQLYRLSENKYAGETYAHQFEGIIQYYKEDLKLEPKQALSFLNIVKDSHIPGRNDPCPCGSGKKIKNCHINSMNDLKDITKEQLTNDIFRLSTYLSNDSNANKE